jgi:hypothetical protein
MAKKAPAKPATKPPAKRKPRPKKPVVPAVVPVVEPADDATPVVFPRWITGGLKAVLLIAVGIAAGIWFAGGIDVSPDNNPEPAPVPVPEPVKSFRAIFVKESGQTLSSEQVAIPGAKEIRDYLNAKTTSEGNQPGWREYDPQQITDNEQPIMKDLWSAVKPQLLPAPCLVIEVNGKATVMPFPNTVAEAIETLKKAGG